MKNVFFRGVLSLFIFGVFFIHCGQSNPDHATQGSGNAGQDPLPRKESKTANHTHYKSVKLKKYSYIDKQGIGMEAFNILMPSDWQFDGGIKWILINPAMPAVASFTIKNPHSPDQLSVYPTQAFFWTNNGSVLSMFPRGSRYFGAEVAQPLSPIQALKQIVIPRFRNNLSNLRIGQAQNLPDLAKELGQANQSQPGVQSSAKGAKIRISYDSNGQAMEEEIYCVVESSSYSMQSMMGMITNTNWVVDYIFSFKAPKGQLDDKTKLFQTMVYSFKLNPLWFSKYNQLVQRLIQQQIRQIQNIGQISRIISQTNNEISDMIMDSYNKRQAVNDRIADNFSQYIRGVDAYHDSVDNKTVELPSGYRHAWQNSLGEYILSDDPNFNPNENSNVSWKEMKRKK